MSFTQSICKLLITNSSSSLVQDVILNLLSVSSMLTHNLSPGDLKLMRKWALRVYPHQVPSSPSGVTLPLMDEYHYRIMQKALSSNFEYNRSRLVGSWLMQTRAYLEQLGLIASTALYCSCALELCRCLRIRLLVLLFNINEWGISSGISLWLLLCCASLHISSLSFLYCVVGW